MDVASWTRWTTWRWLSLLCYFVVLDYLFVYMMVYECRINLLIGKKISKVFILQTNWMFYSLKVYGVYYLWYQSEVETLGPIWLKMLQHVSFELTIEFSLFNSQKTQQVRTVRPIQVPRVVPNTHGYWLCSYAGGGGTSSQITSETPLCIHVST